MLMMVMNRRELLSLVLLFFITLPVLVHSECGCDMEAEDSEGGRNKPEALKYKFIAIASILVLGAIGVCIPILGKSISALNPENDIFFMIKAFAAGVILSTGCMHVLPDAFENLNSPCLKENPWGYHLGSMKEGVTAENLLHSIMDTFADSVPKQKSVSFFEEENSNPVSEQINRLFGRQKPVHKLLGGGKSADVLLWRNKKISASVLTGATAIWVLFEWLNYHFMSLVCLALVLGMLAQFVWSNASGLINRSPSKIPRLVLPDELFVNLAITIGAEVNRFLGYLQDISSGGNLKQFVLVVLSLWAAAVIGGCCNFLTVIYIGFVGAHTLPVLYERYDEQIDSFVSDLIGQLQHHYGKLDASLLSKIPKGKLKGRKTE